MTVEDEAATPVGHAVRHLHPDTAELAALRVWLEDRLAPASDSTDRQLLLIAVTEAVTNAIEAHRRAETEQAIRVELDTVNGLVVVEDRGGGVDPAEIGDRTPPPATAGRGRGLLIIGSICPDARLIETESGTRVELPFSIS